MGNATFVLLRMKVEGVLHGDVIALWQRSETLHSLHGAHGGEVEAGGAAGGFDAHVRGDSVVVYIEDHCRTFAQRGGGIGFGGVPVLRYLAVDDVDVVREALAEGTVHHRDAGRTVFYLQGRLCDANASGLARNRLVGLGWERLNMFRRLGCGFFGCLDGLGELFRNGKLFRIRRWNGLLFRDDGSGAWRLGGKYAGVQGALRRRQRKRCDHGCLDGACVRRLLAPVQSVGAEDKRPAEDDRDDQTVQHQRTNEVAAEVVSAERVFSTEFEVSGYGTLLTFESAG